MKSISEMEGVQQKPLKYSIHACSSHSGASRPAHESLYIYFLELYVLTSSNSMYLLPQSLCTYFLNLDVLTFTSSMYLLPYIYFLKL